MTLTHALKWSFAAELASKAIQPLVFIILARMMTPEDFGVMAAAAMVISFSQIFWEAGMGKALIQRQTDVDAAADAAFRINIVLGAVLACLLLAAAGPIARSMFGDVRVAAVLQVMTVQIVLGAVSSVHTALLQKAMRFRALFWIRFATVGLPGLASIPLAWGGMGYWALVAGTLAGQAVQVAMLWRMSPWRPRRSFDPAVARDLARFGAWVGASGLLAWSYSWLDSLVVGMFLGSHELGLYRTGNQIAIMIFGLIFGPVVPVLYSHLARLGEDRGRLGDEFEKIVRMLAAIGIPVAFTVFAVAEPLSQVVFGDRWQGIGFVLGVLALSHGIAWTVGLNGEIYRAAGRPNLETLAMGLPLVAYVALYITAVAHGFDTFVWSRLLAMTIGLAFQFFLLRRYLGIRLGGICRTVATASLFMLASTYLTGTYVEPHLAGAIAKVAVLGVANLSAYALALYWAERNRLIADIRAIVRFRATDG
jgi:PST family polysaccharide transporter